MSTPQIRYGYSGTQTVYLPATPSVLPANAGNAPDVATPGTRATWAIYDSSGAAVLDSGNLAWESGRRRLYLSDTFPAATYPRGDYAIYYEWQYTGTGEYRQQARYVVSVVGQPMPCVIEAPDLWTHLPALRQYADTDTASEVAALIADARDQLYADLLGAGVDPAIYVDAETLRWPQLAYAVSLACSRVAATDTARNEWAGRSTAALANMLASGRRVAAEAENSPGTRSPILGMCEVVR